MVDPDGGGTIGRLVGRPSRRAASAESDQPVVGPVLTRRISHGRSAEVSSTDSFADALAFASGDADHLALSVVPNPTPEILADLGSAWGLHDLLVEDLVHAHQRPKLERYGDVQFLVVRSARYIDASEEVEFSEFHVLLRSRAVVVVCQDHRLVDGTVITADMSPSDQALLGVGTPLVRQEHLLKLGAEGMVYQLLDAIVDGYVPVLDGLQVDLEQIEHQVFSGDTAAAERIYRLSQEVIDLLHATSALARIVQSLLTGADRDAVPHELQVHLQDVADHLTRVVGESAELREALAQILDVNATLVAQRQNEDMKKISGWAAIFFAPALIAAIYGMNFRIMPELDWPLGYPVALGVMLVFTLGLYLIFKWRKWM
jgi:magnesium transporter